MSARSARDSPSRFKGTVGGLRVSGEVKGKGCRVAVGSKAGVVVARVLTPHAHVTLRIEPAVGVAPPAVIPMSPPPARPARWGGVAAPPGGGVRRTFLLDERGEIEDTTIVPLTPAEFARAAGRPAGPLVPVNSRKLPFGRCDEFYDDEGRLRRTFWSNRCDEQRAA